MQSRFDEAVQLAEQAFLDELVRLTATLIIRPRTLRGGSFYTTALHRAVVSFSACRNNP